MQPELIADYPCETGEGPLWHPMEKRVYWTDIPAGRVFRYDPATGTHEICYTGDVVGGFTVQADGSLLFFMERGCGQGLARRRTHHGDQRNPGGARDSLQ